MTTQDVSQNRRILRLRKLTGELERSSSPLETMRTIRHGLGEAYGIVASLTISTRGLAEGQYRVVQLEIDGELLREISELTPDKPSPVQAGGVVAAIIAHHHVFNVAAAIDERTDLSTGLVRQLSKLTREFRRHDLVRSNAPGVELFYSAKLIRLEARGVSDNVPDSNCLRSH